MAEDPSLTGVIGVIVLFSCYFMPATIALLRGMRGVGSVALVNFFLGWTLIGWFVAFIWSCRDKTLAANRLAAKRRGVAPVSR